MKNEFGENVYLEIYEIFAKEIDIFQPDETEGMKLLIPEVTVLSILVAAFKSFIEGVFKKLGEEATDYLIKKFLSKADGEIKPEEIIVATNQVLPLLSLKTIDESLIDIYEILKGKGVSGRRAKEFATDFINVLKSNLGGNNG